jgi:hypothetical protein
MLNAIVLEDILLNAIVLKVILLDVILLKVIALQKVRTSFEAKKINLICWIVCNFLRSLLFSLKNFILLQNFLIIFPH